MPEMDGLRSSPRDVLRALRVWFGAGACVSAHDSCAFPRRDQSRLPLFIDSSKDEFKSSEHRELHKKCLQYALASKPLTCGRPLAGPQFRAGDSPGVRSLRNRPARGARRLANPGEGAARSWP